MKKKIIKLDKKKDFFRLFWEYEYRSLGHKSKKRTGSNFDAWWKHLLQLRQEAKNVPGNFNSVKPFRDIRFVF